MKPEEPIATETRDLETIETLISTKTQTAQSMDRLASSLQTRLSLLSEAITPIVSDAEHNALVETLQEEVEQLQGENNKLKRTAAKSNFFTFAICAVLILTAVVVGRYSNGWQHQRQEQQTIVRPVTETLEEFVARESEHLTADERRKLIAIAEKILTDHFTTPSAMRESFRYERLRADLTSPEFLTFSDKWAAKVEETAEDTVESMRSIYESLLRGLKVQAYNDREMVAEKNLPSPAAEARQQAAQRIGLLRRR